MKRISNSTMESEQNCRQFSIFGVKKGEYSNNYINTARYNGFTFIPIFLYDQFTRVSNVFFLLVGLMEQLPGVSPVGKFITLVPLFFILCLSALKEIIEDIKRRKSDRIINKQQCEVYRRYWRRCSWSGIMVGDIVRVTSGQAFPADMVIISTSEPTQYCYIQTASLDGETNYKIKQCAEECKKFCNEDQWMTKTALVTCDIPNNNLYKFNGTMEIMGEPSFPIDHEQVALRGCQLKNTRWVLGVVVYTGHESKIMLNYSRVVIKRSAVDHATNWLVLCLLGILLVLTIFSATAYEVYFHNISPSHWYLHISKLSSINFHLSLMTSFITFHNIIPISLVVTVEIVKMIQSYLISSDTQMYSHVSHTTAQVKTSSIVEELGQVNYIFTDKTGTLTCNEMVLKELSIGSQIYKLDGNAFDFDLVATLNQVDQQLFLFFFINLLLCNSIVVEYEKESPEPVFQSSSPDETAIIMALYERGYKFVKRVASDIHLSIKGNAQVWKILQTIDFTSDRKRMSVIAKSQDGNIFLFSKGADNVISKMLRMTDDIVYESTMNHLETFAKDGLRTLCVAYKSITESEYQDISQQFSAAYAHIDDRESVIEAVAEGIEQGMSMLGATGIEDKLQPNVPETICSLKKANIKIWMLTGDKLETAINIGYSCSLLSNTMDVRVFSCNSIESCLDLLRRIQTEKEIPSSIPGKMRFDPVLRTKLALVLTGSDLSFALDPACIEIFLDVVIYCSAVICCRVSPLQKTNVLLMIKDRVAMTTTLAIGDGANDCSMIKAANVGVGIIGKEGLQAANTADFAIGEFSHLTRLLFVHGAASYRRICNCIYFCFYKNIVFNLLPLYYNFFNMFSSQIIFSRVQMALFNVCYTSLPPFCFGLLDRSCSLEAHFNVPYLYESVRKSTPFGLKRFFYWILNGLLHSVLIFYLSYGLSHSGVINADGSPISSAIFANLVFTHTLIVITMKAALELRYWFWMTHVGVYGGLISYIIFITFFCRRVPLLIWFEPNFFDSDILLYHSAIFWLSLGIPLIVLLPDFLFHCIRNTWFPPSYLRVTELERQQLINWTEPNSIRVIQTELDRSAEMKSRRTKKYFGFAFSFSETASFKNMMNRRKNKNPPKPFVSDNNLS